MLRGKRIVCLLSTSLLFTYPTNIQAPFHSLAEQSIEKQIDLNGMVQDLRLKKFQEQVEKDRKEIEKKKADESKLQKEKEFKKQNNNEPQWQDFELTFYTSLAEENSGTGTKSVTCTGGKLYDGVVASNYYKINTKIKLNGWGEVTVLDKGSDKYFNNDYRLDVYIPREQGESDRNYYSRVNKMGKVKIKGQIIK